MRAKQRHGAAPIVFADQVGETGSNPGRALQEQLAKVREAFCIECACSDFNACPGGCAWAVVYRRLRVGICTRCQRGRGIMRLRWAVRRFLRQRKSFTTVLRQQEQGSVVDA